MEQIRGRAGDDSVGDCVDDADPPALKLQDALQGQSASMRRRLEKGRTLTGDQGTNDQP
jgi:hypothetical protein